MLSHGKAIVVSRGADSQFSLKGTELNIVRKLALYCVINY